MNYEKPINIIDVNRHNREYIHDNLARRHEYSEIRERSREQHRRVGHKTHETAKVIAPLVTMWALIATVALLQKANLTDDKSNEQRALDELNRQQAYEQDYDYTTKITIRHEDDLGCETGILSEIPQDFSELYGDAVEAQPTANMLYQNFQKLYNNQELKVVGKNNEAKIWNLFKQIGFSDVQAAAMLGNIKKEDPSLNPFQHQIFNNMPTCSNDSIVGNSLGVGLMQHSGTRKDDFYHYLKHNSDFSHLLHYYNNPKSYSFMNHEDAAHKSLESLGLDEETVDDGLLCQVCFIMEEIGTTESNNFNNCFSEDQSVADAAELIAQKFERTGDKNSYDSRRDNAESYYYEHVV